MAVAPNRSAPAIAKGAPLSSAPTWLRVPEVGTVWGIRFVVGLARVCGRAAAGAFLGIVALYYALLSARTRRVSRDYLVRVGEEPTFRNVLRHVHTFARVALDRLFFLRGAVDDFVIERHGHELVMDLAAKRTGAILLGAHLGSFEAMRAAARDFGVPLSVVVDARSAERLARVLRDLSSDAGPNDAKVSVIPVDPKGVQTVFLVKEAIERGELVAILADRTMGKDGRNVTVDVLGAPAELPVGPYIVAHTVKCPVLLAFGLFREPNRYELHCEPFCDEVRLERKSRAESLRAYAQRYADRLSFHARSAPFNWFNFYDFWNAS